MNVSSRDYLLLFACSGEASARQKRHRRSAGAGAGAGAGAEQPKGSAGGASELQTAPVHDIIMLSEEERGWEAGNVLELDLLAPENRGTIGQ